MQYSKKTEYQPILPAISRKAPKKIIRKKIKVPLQVARRYDFFLGEGRSRIWDWARHSLPVPSLVLRSLGPGAAAASRPRPRPGAATPWPGRSTPQTHRWHPAETQSKPLQTHPNNQANRFETVVDTITFVGVCRGIIRMMPTQYWK